MKSSRKGEKKSSVEMHDDAWKRFERAVDVVAKSPPQPKVKKAKKKSALKKPRKKS